MILYSSYYLSLNHNNSFIKLIFFQSKLKKVMILKTVENIFKYLFKNNLFLDENWDLMLVLILFLVLASIFFKYYQYQAGFGSDTISYINIAKAYASGNWVDAINAYWSPLYSWLMTPFLLFGSTPLYALYVSKIVSLIIGFFTIIGVRRLYLKFEMDILVNRIFLFSLIPVIIYFSLSINTPDLLVVLILVYYLSFIFDVKYPNKLVYGVLCGFCGSLAYLTKSYLFFFFIIHFLFFNFFYLFKFSNKEKKQKLFKNLILGFTVFFVISGLWIGSISDKYGKLTISTAGEYNYAIMGPKNTDSFNIDLSGISLSIIKPIHPLYTVGLIKPPYNISNSIWDEPSFTKIDKWSPFSSWKNFKYQLDIIEKNILYSLVLIESFFAIALMIIISGLLFVLSSKPEKLSRHRMLYLLITMFIYIGGYCLILVEWRYFWFIFILIMFIGYFLVDNLYKNGITNLNWRNLLLIILLLSFVIQPIYELVLFSDSDNSIIILSNKLKTDYRIKGNIASDDNWGEMVTISYFLNTKYYGLPKKTNSTIDLQKELEEKKIDYFFVWNKANNKTLYNYKEITGGVIRYLLIYKKLN